MKKLETFYDQLYEKYRRQVSLIESCSILNTILEKFHNLLNSYSNDWKEQIEENGNKLNEMMKQIQQLEKKRIDSGFNRNFLVFIQDDVLVLKYIGSF